MKFSGVFLTSLSVFTTAIVVQVTPSLALTFAEVNQGQLILSNGQEQVGFGSFSYSEEVITGSFIFSESTVESLFYKNLPNNIFYDEKLELTIDDNWRVIEEISITLREGNTSTTLDYMNSLNFTSDEPEFFSKVLLFKAKNDQKAPIDNELATISIGDFRSPNLSQKNRWFLSDGATGVGAGYQLGIDGDGDFNGFVLDLPTVGVGGTWMATPDYGSLNQQTIPEPLTILGAATAIGFGTFFKNKLK